MAKRASVHVTGLNHLEKGLRTFYPELRVELKDRFGRIASRIAFIVKGRVPVGKSKYDRHKGRARASVRWSSTAAGARVTEGRKSVPFMRWLDFGGELKPSGRRHGVRTREVVRKGRYLYPVVDAHRHEIERDAERAVAEVMRKAGL